MQLKELVKAVSVSTVPDEEIQAWVDGLKDRQLMMLQVLLSQAKGNPPEPKKEEPPMPPEVAKRFADEQSKVETLSKALADVVAARETEQFEKLATDLQAIPGLPIKRMATVLKTAAHALPKEEYDDVLKCLRSADAAIRKLDISRSIGGTGNGEGTMEPGAQLTVLTQEMIKSNRAKTWGEASALVARENPDVYAAYVQARAQRS